MTGIYINIILIILFTIFINIIGDKVVKNDDALARFFLFTILYLLLTSLVGQYYFLQYPLGT